MLLLDLLELLELLVLLRERAERTIWCVRSMLCLPFPFDLHASTHAVS
jgi:hypothetical protein